MVLAVLAAWIDRNACDVTDKPLVDDPSEPALVELLRLAACNDGPAAARHELGEQIAGRVAPQRLDVP